MSETAKDILEATRQKTRRAVPGIVKVGVAFIVVGLGAFALTYILNGGQGAGFAWFKLINGAGSFAAWRVNAYVWVLVPLVPLLGFGLRYLLPIVIIPAVGAGKGGHDKIIEKWYRPGSFDQSDNLAQWKEGKLVAQINVAHVAKRGVWGLVITHPVERNVNQEAGIVSYDDADVATYHSIVQRERLRYSEAQRSAMAEQARRERRSTRRDA